MRQFHWLTSSQSFYREPGIEALASSVHSLAKWKYTVVYSTSSYSSYCSVTEHDDCRTSIQGSAETTSRWCHSSSTPPSRPTTIINTHNKQHNSSPCYNARGGHPQIRKESIPERRRQEKTDRKIRLLPLHCTALKHTAYVLSLLNICRKFQSLACSAIGEVTS